MVGLSPGGVNGRNVKQRSRKTPKPPPGISLSINLLALANALSVVKKPIKKFTLPEHIKMLNDKDRMLFTMIMPLIT
jgi:hypothetical protein